MVVIVLKDELTGMTQEKLKHPDSLIHLEDRLRLEQDIAADFVERKMGFIKL